MTIRRGIFTLSMLIVAVAFAQVARTEPSYKLLKKVPYANVDDTQFMLEVVVPTGKANGLGVIYVATGAGYVDDAKINERNRDELQIAYIFCDRGYTLFIVRPGPKSKYNVIDMADHLQRAITFVKQNADQYQIDADHLGLLSTSSGVHLVSLVAVTATNETAVGAAGVYYPPRDFRNKDLYIQANSQAWERINKQAFPGGIGPAPATSAAADVKGNALDIGTKLPQVSRKAPPFLFVHGDADPLIGTASSNLYFTAMRDAGIATEMVVKRPGGDPGPTIKAELTTLANWFDKKLTQ